MGRRGRFAQASSVWLGQFNLSDGGRFADVGRLLLHGPSYRLLLRWNHARALLPEDIWLREVRNYCAKLCLRMEWRRCLRWCWQCRWYLAHPSGMAPELLLQCAPCRLVLLLSQEGALLQRLWAFCGLHHPQPDYLALLKPLSSTERRVLFFLRTSEIVQLYRLSSAIPASHSDVRRGAGL